jgi:hypothetical protein
VNLEVFEGQRLEQGQGLGVERTTFQQHVPEGPGPVGDPFVDRGGQAVTADKTVAEREHAEQQVGPVRARRLVRQPGNRVQARFRVRGAVDAALATPAHPADGGVVADSGRRQPRRVGLRARVVDPRVGLAEGADLGP